MALVLLNDRARFDWIGKVERAYYSVTRPEDPVRALLVDHRDYGMGRRIEAVVRARTNTAVAPRGLVPAADVDQPCLFIHVYEVIGSVAEANTTLTALLEQAPRRAPQEVP
jgi:hypothetical protein